MKQFLHKEVCIPEAATRLEREAVAARGNGGGYPLVTAASADVSNEVSSVAIARTARMFSRGKL